MAIGMKLTKATGEYDLGCSKFFGTPTIPGEMLEELDGDLMFLAQIRLADIAALDPENILPHTGYLYFFVDGNAGYGSDVLAEVRYYPGEPDTAVDDFNEGFEIPGVCEDWLITFEEVEEDADGNKLLGVPYDWNYEDEPPMLLLQYDPLETEAGFLSFMDGMAYFFAGEDRKNFTDAVWHAEYS